MLPFRQLHPPVAIAGLLVIAISLASILAFGATT